MSQECKSILNKNFSIDETQAVISLVRKPYGINPEHAFILVESFDASNKIRLARYELVIDRENVKNCRVIDNKQFYDPKQPEEAAKALNVLLQSDQIVGKSWPVTKNKAQTLVNNILDSQQRCKVNPQAYNLLGDDAVTPRSGDGIRYFTPSCADATCNTRSAIVKAALSPSGKSCMSWAREMLLSLNDSLINRELPSSPFNLIATKSSRYLPTKESSSSCRIM